MSSYDFDLFTIGAGSGGVRASRIAANLGAKVAIAEGRFFGGTCVNVGCVPKKLMVYASHFREEFNDAQGFGWGVSAPTFDWSVFLARKDAEITRLNGVYRRILDGAKVAIFEGNATIVAPHTVEVRGADNATRQYTAEHILLATGGQPTRPTIPGAEHCLVSDDLFRLKALPSRMVIVGGGYIAVEFASIFHGLGVEVSLVYRGDLFLRGFDDEVRNFLVSELQKKQLRLCFQREITAVENQGGQLQVCLNDGQSIEADAVLYAIGREPNVLGLGLERVGVKQSARGAIIVDQHYQTNIEKIYAIGDVIEHISLTPVALAQGMFLARRLFGGATRPVDYTDVATAVFSQPPISTVGLTEQQAQKQFSKIEVYTAEFTPLKNTLSGNKEKVFMKLIVDVESDRVVGVHMVGSDAAEIIQLAAVALKCSATKAQFDATIGIHPTAAEEFVTMRTPRKSQI